VLLGSWFASESLTPRILLAAMIIIGSVVFINSERRPISTTGVKESEEAISTQ